MVETYECKEMVKMAVRLNEKDLQRQRNERMSTNAYG